MIEIETKCSKTATAMFKIPSLVPFCRNRCELDEDDKKKFSVKANEAFVIKIARGVTSQNIWGKGEVEVKTVTLSHAEALHLDVRFSVVHDQAADDAFDEAIREADSALEALI